MGYDDRTWDGVYQFAIRCTIYIFSPNTYNTTLYIIAAYIRSRDVLVYIVQYSMSTETTPQDQNTHARRRYDIVS